MNKQEQFHRPFGTALIKETADQIRLREFRALYTREQLADLDAREMGHSIALIKQWARETEECRPGGIVDQRQAKIDARNITLPEKERLQRTANLAREKSAALRGASMAIGGGNAEEFLEDSERPSVIVVSRASLLKVRKHRAQATYSVIDTLTHKAVVKDLEDLPLANAVAGLVSAQPEYEGSVEILRGQHD